MKSKRVEYFKKSSKGRTLDLGCDFGLLHSLLDDGKMLGLDISNENYKERVIKGNVLKMPIKDASLDTVIAGELLEHMPGSAPLLKECSRILRKNGTLLISTPNKKAWSNRLFHHFDHASAEEEYPHQNVLDGKSLREECEKFFEVKEFFYLPYDEVSSPNRFTQKGMRAANLFYPIRKIVHNLVPKEMGEQMVIKCQKK